MKKNTILLLALICSLQIIHAQNVGIGTTNPGFKLTVQTQKSAGNWGLMHTDSVVQVGDYISSNGIAEFGTRSAHPLFIIAGNNDAHPAIAIDAAGINVGIGKAAPVYNLDVKASGNAQFNLTEGIGLQTALFSRYTNRLEIQPSDAFQISIGGIDRRNLCVANNGYVGVQTAAPTNLLQVGTYTNAGYGGNQLALGLGSNVTVMNQYASLSNFQSSTALNIQSAHDIYLMPGNGDGHVGINTNTPVYPLEIDATTAFGNIFTPAAYYGAGFNISGQAGPSTGGETNETSIALYAGGTICAGTYYALSDSRIKNIIGSSNSVNDLETLNKIKITDYTMKDRMTYGNRFFKKVIAQELEEVYPQAVNRQANFIPNTYLRTDKITRNDGSYTLHFSKEHHISKNAKLLKVYSKKGDSKLPVLNVLSSFDVVVKATDLEESLFVYGEQVNDFRTVDYEGLATLNVSATQELCKIIKQQQTAMEQQNEQIKNITAKLESLMDEINLLKKKN
jgi:Chaperone of endosialidase